nr:RNA-directed DNA polymerase, eukaryota [Tanacetum cinerariifolium]
MGRARERAYAIGGGILHAIDSSSDEGDDGDEIGMVVCGRGWRLEQLDEYIEENQQNAEATEERIELSKKIADLKKRKGMDIAQKVKKKWGLREMEIQFFHLSLNRKRRKVAINGVLEDSCLIGRFRKGSTLQMHVLSHEFSMEEIKEAFWSCKSDRAPGCNASFITLIPKLLANRLAKIIEDIVDPVQLAFVKGRQILDGPMVVNEVIDWYNKKNKKCMLFKIDFDKAFDSVGRGYLFKVMEYMGFNETWIQWIRTCLTSSWSSILVNGSPTNELSPLCRQGDPMSLFLFIIVIVTPPKWVAEE